MNDKTDKHDELLAEVEKSESRLRNTAAADRFPDRSPPEKVTQLIREHPGLAIAAGLGVGLLVAAVLPKGPGRKLIRRSGLVATAATEMALLMGKNFLAKATEATEEGRDHLSEAAERASSVSRSASRKAQKLAGETSAAVRSAGSDLAKKATKSLARLRD